MIRLVTRRGLFTLLAVFYLFISPTFVAWSQEPPQLYLTQLRDNVPWEHIGAAAAFMDRLYAFGTTPAHGDQPATSDVWRSDDGYNWIRISTTAPWPATSYLKMSAATWRYGTPLGTTMVVAVPGSSGKVWRTSDGITWTDRTPSNFHDVVDVTLVPEQDYLRLIYSVSSSRWLYTSNVKTTSTSNLNTWNSAVAMTTDALLGWATAVFLDKAWLLGGIDTSPSCYQACSVTLSSTQSVYHSDNTASFSLLATAPWPNRGTATTFNLDGRLWLLGGKRYDEAYSCNQFACDAVRLESEILTDIWSTVDGVNWEQTPSSISFTGRPHVAVMKNRAYLVGNGDVWVAEPQPETPENPSDLSWVRKTEAAPWAPRHGGHALSHDGYLWVLPGAPNERDVWRSIDGSEWQLVTNDVPWQKTSKYGAAVFNGAMWVASDDTIWTSVDGATWSEVTTSNFNVEDENNLFVFNNRLYHADSNGKISNSVTGETWGSALTFSSREGLAAAGYAGKYLLSGGRGLSTRTYRQFPSGLTVYEYTWSPLATTLEQNAIEREVPWRARYRHAMLPFADRLWVFGGKIDTQVRTCDPGCADEVIVAGTLSDIWSYASGRWWVKSQTSAPFGHRASMAATEHNGALYVLGGSNADGDALGDVWAGAYGIVAEGEGGVEGTGEGEGITEGTVEGVTEGEGEAVTEGGAEGTTEGVSEGEGVAEGEGEGLAEGLAEGADEGTSEGEGEGVAEGGAEGTTEGEGEGVTEGGAEGGAEGGTDGEGEGLTEGGAEGGTDGEGEGVTEGEELPLTNYKLLLVGFAGIDENADNLLSITEIQAHLEAFPVDDFEAADANGDGQLSVAELRNVGGGEILLSADISGDFVLGLGELLRVIQLYNAGQYYCAQNPGASEDGFVATLPESEEPSCMLHSIDRNYNKVISLSELLRAIQFYNLGRYTSCADEHSEDGFCG